MCIYIAIEDVLVAYSNYHYNYTKLKTFNCNYTKKLELIIQLQITMDPTLFGCLESCILT